MNYNKTPYNSDAKQILEQWADNLKLVKAATHPSALELIKEDLTSLHRRASVLVQHHQQSLHPVVAAGLTHITARPLEQHLAIVKAQTIVSA